MLRYKNRYKDRTPKQTVKIIKQFFINKGYEIKEVTNNKTEADTWFCHLTLIKDGNPILVSNGKGTKQEFSLASGYAELYERFCNRCPLDEKILFNYYRGNFYKKNKGYYYDISEKELTLEEIKNNILVRSILFPYANEDEEFYEQLIYFLTNNFLVGVPYHSLDSNEIIYNQPTLLARMLGSQGMAAGNTLEEALVQSNSEIYEKYVGQNFFLNNFEKYHAIDFSKIKNKFILNKINKILSLGYKFYVIDLSYNYNMPVLMSILIEPTRGQLYTNFGAFPNFDIALERIITELYQGIVNHKQNYFNFIVPYKNDNILETLSQYLDTNIENCFPETFFDKIEYGDYNHDIFSNGHSSIELLNYFKKLNKELGYKFYYRETSISNKMTAIQMYCPTLNLNCLIKELLKQQRKKLNFDTIKEIFSIYHSLLIDIINENYDFQKYHILFDYISFSSEEFNYAQFFLLEDPIDVFLNHINLLSVFIKFFGEYERGEIIRDLKDTSFFKPILKYLLLYPYKNNSQYSYEEIEKIFNNLFDFNLTKKEYECCKNGEFFLEETLFKTQQNNIQKLLKLLSENIFE